MTKVARLYYEQGLRQTAIVERLGLSQATISRLLRRAQEEQIVRILVTPPKGTHSELEAALESSFSLKQAIVVDSALDDEETITRDLGAAAAFFLETTLRPREVIGISSWSSTLLAMVRAMHPIRRAGGVSVVQILGGVGSPAAEVHATRLTERLASLVKGEAVFLAAPGVTGSARSRGVLLRDRYVSEAVGLFSKVSLALVGIGALEPSRLLAESGNVFSKAELRGLRRDGAVGDICLRFFDSAGQPVESALNQRVIGMDLHELRRVERAVGIAGGRRKLTAIRGALRGRLVNVLITDRFTAERLAGGEAGQ